MPHVHDVEIIPPDNPHQRVVGALYKVIIDGRQIHPSNVVIKLRPDRPVEIELELPIVTIASFSGQATVSISPGDEDTLIGLGWTRPNGDHA